MEEEKLWETFAKTGHIADYLRYRGVDVYAATNTVDRKGEPYAECTEQKRGTPDRRSYHSGI